MNKSPFTITLGFKLQQAVFSIAFNDSAICSLSQVLCITLLMHSYKIATEYVRAFAQKT